MSPEREMIYFSLNMRACYIETGDPVLRAKDAEESGQSDKVKALSIGQMKAIIMIDDLMTKCYKGDPL